MPQHLSYPVKTIILEEHYKGWPKLGIYPPAHANKRFCLLRQQHLFLITLGIFFVVGGVDGDPCCVLANPIILADTPEVGYNNNVGVTLNHQPKGFFLLKTREAGVSASKTHNRACSCQWNEMLSQCNAFILLPKCRGHDFPWSHSGIVFSHIRELMQI